MSDKESTKKGSRLALPIAAGVVATFLVAWLGFALVSFPTVEGHLGINPPYAPGWLVGEDRVDDSGDGPYLTVDAPVEGETVYVGTMLEGTVLRADEVYLWVKGVNVPTQATVDVQSGTWSFMVEEKRLPEGELTLVFAARQSGAKVWGPTTEVTITSSHEVLPYYETWKSTQYVPPPPPNFMYDKIVQPLVQIVQPVGEALMAPVVAIITETDVAGTVNDMDNNGVPDVVQTTPFAPDSPIPLQYFYVLIITGSVVAIVAYVVIWQPGWFRNWLSRRQDIKEQKTRFKYSLKYLDRNLDHQRSATRLKTGLAEKLRDLQNQAEIAKARAAVKRMKYFSLGRKWQEDARRQQAEAEWRYRQQIAQARVQEQQARAHEAAYESQKLDIFINPKDAGRARPHKKPKKQRGRRRGRNGGDTQ